MPKTKTSSEGTGKAEKHRKATRTVAQEEDAQDSQGRAPATQSEPVHPAEIEGGSNGEDADPGTVAKNSQPAEPDDNKAEGEPDEQDAGPAPLAQSWVMNDPTEQRQYTAPDGSLVTEEQMEEQLELIYGAKHVIMLFVPVSLCMMVVVATISSVQFFSRDDKTYLVYTPFHPDERDSGGQALLKTVYNSLIVIAVVVVMTFVLIFLYKQRCYKCIHGWIMMSSMMMLFMFAFLYLQELLKAYQVPMDLITTTFCLFNFGVTGLIVIHWKGPLIVQQGYLIITAALMSLVFIKYLPEWTLWLVLAFLAIWDLIAVLTPHGPLKMLVETAQERGEQVMPALIYSSTVMYPFVAMAKTQINNQSDRNRNRHRMSSTMSSGDACATPRCSATAIPTIQHEEAVTARALPCRNKHYRARKLSTFINRNSNNKAEEPATPDDVSINDGEVAPVRDTAERVRHRTSDRIAQLEHNIEQEEERGVKLGLGDFIFYSVLVGKASASREPITTIACFIGILMGLFLTLAILVTVNKALPALPFSILFGLIFNFGSSYLIVPMVQDFASSQVFI